MRVVQQDGQRKEKWTSFKFFIFEMAKVEKEKKKPCNFQMIVYKEQRKLMQHYVAVT